MLTYKNIRHPLKYARKYLVFQILLKLYYQESMNIAELESYCTGNVSKVWT